MENEEKKLTKMQKHYASIGGMTTWNIRPVDLTNEKSVRRRITDYMKSCQVTHKEPSPVGLANWLGVSRTTMMNWRAGKFGSTPGEAIIQRDESC